MCRQEAYIENTQQCKCVRWHVLCEGSRIGAYVAFTPVHGARRVPIQVMRGPYMGRGWTSGLADCTEAASTPGQH